VIEKKQTHQNFLFVNGYFSEVKGDGIREEGFSGVEPRVRKDLFQKNTHTQTATVSYLRP